MAMQSKRSGRRWRIVCLVMNLHHLPDKFPQYGDPILRLFIPGLSKTHANAVIIITVGGEDLPGNDRNAVLHRFRAQLECIDTFVELHPEHKASMRTGYFCILREMIDDSLDIAKTLRVQGLPHIL